MKTRRDAVVFLMNEAVSDKIGSHSARKAGMACAILGLSEDDASDVKCFLEMNGPINEPKFTRGYREVLDARYKV